MPSIFILVRKPTQQKTIALISVIGLITVLAACQPNSASISTAVTDPAISNPTNSILGILNSISNLLPPIIIAVLGIIAGNLYRGRELDIARAGAIQKFFDHLLSVSDNNNNENSKVQASLLTISTLGDPKIAIQLAELLATQKAGAIYALDRFASSSDKKISRLARASLENIMEKPHFWDIQTNAVLSLAKAYKVINDIVTDKRTYSEEEIYHVFEDACTQNEHDKRIGTNIALCLDIYRMNTIYRLLHYADQSFLYKKILFWKEEQIRKQFVPMIALFKIIIDINKNKQSSYFHGDYAHLAYVYKDLPTADWSSALEYIRLAIAALKESQDMSMKMNQQVLATYQMNEILCLYHSDINHDAEIAELLTNCADTLWHELNHSNPILLRGFQGFTDEKHYPESVAVIKMRHWSWRPDLPVPQQRRSGK